MQPSLTARGAPLDVLLELVWSVRAELLLREEAPVGNWVEDSANDLRDGRKAGWFYPMSDGGGLAFRSERGSESFGHVHVEASTDALDRAINLSETLLDSLPDTIHCISIGFTGLPTDREAVLIARLAQRPGSTVIQRFAMERALGTRDGEGLVPIPDGLRLVPLRDITLDAIAELDYRAFRGTTDELLIGTNVTQYRRVLASLLSGELGRFLDEASTSLYRPDPPKLVGAILTCEKSPRHAVFLDFMVDPDLRGRGYGEYLLRWGLRALWALGYERARLWVSAANESARRLYDSVGFSVTHTAAIYRWDRAAPVPQAQSVR